MNYIVVLRLIKLYMQNSIVNSKVVNSTLLHTRTHTGEHTPTSRQTVRGGKYVMSTTEKADKIASVCLPTLLFCD